jgi:outer membrane protein assembly factor BamA
MKKTFFAFLILMLVHSVSAQETKVKTGWRFGGALPAITYDSDLGFQYGALAEFFNYGDGSKYPDFLDHTYTEISRYTKGSGIYRFMYESNHLIPGVHMTSDLSYLPDQASHFYGFNGYESVYNKDWEDEDSPLYRTRMFYRYQRNQFRFKNDFQGKLSGDHLKWSAGFAFQDFKNRSVDINKLNKGKSSNLLPSVDSVPGLFERYKSLGLISPDEANGGWVNTVKAGLMWDSRDNKPCPMKGVWTEIGVEIAPKFMGNDWGFSRLYIIHRHYFTLIEKDLSFVYRLGYQTKMSGDVPFFYQSQVITSMLTGSSNEGLGGSKTLRGILLNRVIGDGFIMGNIELRWKPLYFKFFKQECYLGLDGFYDFGRITKDVKLPNNLRTTFNDVYSAENYSSYFNPGAEKFHQSAGISVMLVMNQNFVIAIDLGKAFNEQDGNIGFSIGLNYLF